MEKKWTFFKFAWLPLLLMIGGISFTVYMAWREETLKSNLIEQAIQGNQYAIKILAHYEKPWRLDHRIIKAALQGNQNALAVLKIEATHPS